VRTLTGCSPSGLRDSWDGVIPGRARTPSSGQVGAEATALLIVKPNPLRGTVRPTVDAAGAFLSLLWASTLGSRTTRVVSRPRPAARSPTAGSAPRAGARSWPRPTPRGRRSVGVQAGAPPEFERLLEDLEAGLLAGVICWKLDRLARSHRDFERLWEIMERRSAKLVSLHEQFDTSRPAGEFSLRMMVGMARMESQNIALRRRSRLAEKRDAGEPHTGGCRPTATAPTS
jgi:Resolvase, N terminal domain